MAHDGRSQASCQHLEHCGHAQPSYSEHSEHTPVPGGQTPPSWHGADACADAVCACRAGGWEWDVVGGWAAGQAHRDVRVRVCTPIRKTKVPKTTLCTRRSRASCSNQDGKCAGHCGNPPLRCFHAQMPFAAAIAQLGERQTEDLKVPGSIPGLGNMYLYLMFLCSFPPFSSMSLYLDTPTDYF